jgi:hypothetical protein
MIGMPNTLPSVTARGGVAAIKRVYPIDSDGLINAPHTFYDIVIIDSNGRSLVVEEVPATNDWYDHSTHGLRCYPPTIGSEWPCQYISDRLLLWVWPLPAIGPCSGETPPSGDDVPIGGSTPGTPSRPIGIPGPAFAHMLLAMSTQQLASFYLAGKAAAGETTP